MPWRCSSAHALSVEPTPANGSSTVIPRLVNIRTRRATSVNENGAGCSRSIRASAWPAPRPRCVQTLTLSLSHSRAGRSLSVLRGETSWSAASGASALDVTPARYRNGACPQNRRAAAAAAAGDSPPGRSPRQVRHGADAELVALRVGHHDVVVVGIAVVPDHAAAERGQPLDLGALVVGVEVEVHLIAGGDWRPRELEGQTHVISLEHAEVVAGRLRLRAEVQRPGPEPGHQPDVR